MASYLHCSIQTFSFSSSTDICDRGDDNAVVLDENADDELLSLIFSV